MRRPPLWLGFGAILFAVPFAGQTPAAPAASPRFDVVSIKIDPSGRLGGAWSRTCSSGRWTGKNVRIATLIDTAYGIAQSEVQGIPAWDTRPMHQFDITATCPEGTVDSQVQPMLLAMLVNRFAFKAHFAIRVEPARTLELAKSGPRMKPASGKCVNAPSAPALPEGEHRCDLFYVKFTGPGGGYPMDGQPMVQEYQAWSATTADLVKFLGRMGRFDQPPLVDATGLSGKYDFDLQVHYVLNLKDAEGRPVDQGFELIKAMRDELGLIVNDRHLKKEPIRVLVVDSVSMPTPN